MTNRISVERSTFKELAMQAYPRLVPARKRVVKYVLDHLKDSVFLTVGELAERTRVDPATVVRTAQAMGFDGYGDFIESAQEYFLLMMTPYEVLESSTRMGNKSPDSRCRYVIKQDLENLQTTLKNLNPTIIRTLARRIHASKQTLIVGLDFAGSLTFYLEYVLTAMNLAVIGIMAGGGRLRYRLHSVTPQHVVIGISFRRCLRETVEAIQFARKRGAFTFGITDSELSPLAKEAEACVLTPIVSPSPSGSYVGPLGVINAIIVECSHVNRPRTLKALKQMHKEYDKGDRWYQMPRAKMKTS